MNMYKKESIAQFGAVEYYWQWLGALFWRFLRKYGIYQTKTLKDQILDRIAPFDEYPACDLCGSKNVKEVFITADNSRIVKCERCNVLFTSPRIDEKEWINYLRTPSKRSIMFTENRVKYGVALPSNIRYSMPNWFSKKIEEKTRIIEHIEKYLIGSLNCLHDVGCGVGFQIMAAEKRGIKASGNDLNGYAFNVMVKRFGLTIHHKELPETPITDSTLDAIIMNDYIEHTYHPKRDLEKAYSLLRPNGVLYIHTFHIDCHLFDEHRENWNYLFWNHTYHFSIETLTQVLTSIGYQICYVDASYDSLNMKIIARKPI